MTEQDAATDAVTQQWLTQHQIRIPRVPGVHESSSAWVKVNQRGTIVAAGKKDRTVLSWLIARAVLGRIDEEYGIAFLTTRSAFRGSLDAVPSSLYDRIIAQGGVVSGADNAALYQQVCRDIGRDYRRAIEYACDTPFISDRPNDEKDEGNAKLRHFNYRPAFSALIKSFDEAIRQLSERRRSS